MTIETKRQLAEQLIQMRNDTVTRLEQHTGNSDFWNRRLARIEKELADLLKNIDPVASW